MIVGPRPTRRQLPVPSDRLVRVLREYCYRLRSEDLADLAESMSTGSFPWLRDDLTAALEDATLTTTWWRATVSDAVFMVPWQARGSVEAAQRHLWDRLFPAHPFPLASPRDER
ncbi:hypothetical protein [Cryptosporangium sp. NPDC048952]|uniref:hypothetical protein n=1 Tax=Cryptosporangium sp. NPDC048952 TaxID=3363961 RepID=UPI00371CFAF8